MSLSCSLQNPLPAPATLLGLPLALGLPATDRRVVSPVPVGLLLVFATLSSLSLPAFAGAGHDHGEVPVVAPAAVSPRFAATSETFELVGVLAGRQLTLYLDHFADSRPVENARLTLSLDGSEVPLTPHGAGEFIATLAAAPEAGSRAVLAQVQAGGVDDLLAADWDIAASYDDYGADAGRFWQRWSAWALAALGASLLLGGIWRHRRGWRTSAHAQIGGAQ